MIKARFVPLTLDWFPNARHASERLFRCPFKSSYARTLDLLEYELEKLEATDIEIHAGFDRRDVRNDGAPRSGADTNHPAVILTFHKGKDSREYSFPCDRFAHWKVNLHAIAYTLKALRDVERYGVGRGNEQYSGFAQLEAPRRMTVEMAAGWLGHCTPNDDVLESVVNYRRAYKIAAARFHPDAPGSNESLWHKLTEVKELLDRHFGIASAAQ